MSIAFDPNETFELVLWQDRDKPQPPALIFRFLTARETRQVDEHFRAYDEASTDAETIAAAVAGIRVGLVGWRLPDRQGKPIPYEPERLDDVYSAIELQEIRTRLLREMGLTELDRKKIRVAVLIAWGQLCSDCRGGRCHDAPSEREPALIECVGCAGGGCPTCGDRGRIVIDSCPSRMVDSRTWQLLELAHFAAQGSWPVAGGVLDQAQVFLEACRFIWADEAKIKQEIMTNG